MILHLRTGSFGSLFCLLYSWHGNRTRHAPADHHPGRSAAPRPLAMELQRRLVKRALRSVDPDLYLEERWSSLGFPYFAIMYPIGEGIDPLESVPWVHKGTPLPLSLSIVDKLRRQEGNIAEAIKQATAANIARKERARAERMAAQEDLIDEYHKWDKRGFVPIPKGVKRS